MKILLLISLILLLLLLLFLIFGKKSKTGANQDERDTPSDPVKPTELKNRLPIIHTFGTEIFLPPPYIDIIQFMNGITKEDLEKQLIEVIPTEFLKLENVTDTSNLQDTLFDIIKIYKYIGWHPDQKIFYAFNTLLDFGDFSKYRTCTATNVDPFFGETAICNEKNEILVSIYMNPPQSNTQVFVGAISEETFKKLNKIEMVIDSKTDNFEASEKIYRSVLTGNTYEISQKLDEGLLIAQFKPILSKELFLPKVSYHFCRSQDGNNLYPCDSKGSRVYFVYDLTLLGIQKPITGFIPYYISFVLSEENFSAMFMNCNKQIFNFSDFNNIPNFLAATYGNALKLIILCIYKNSIIVIDYNKNKDKIHNNNVMYSYDQYTAQLADPYHFIDSKGNSMYSLYCNFQTEFY